MQGRAISKMRIRMHRFVHFVLSEIGANVSVSAISAGWVGLVWVICKIRGLVGSRYCLGAGSGYKGVAAW